MDRDQPADDRKSRLAAALRANLKRRKAQARARDNQDAEREKPAATQVGSDRS